MEQLILKHWKKPPRKLHSPKAISSCNDRPGEEESRTASSPSLPRKEQRGRAGATLQKQSRPRGMGAEGLEGKSNGGECEGRQRGRAEA